MRRFSLFLLLSLSGCVFLTGYFRPPSCGDGFVTPELGEDCDDGNTQDGDTCPDDCLILEGCGDGDVDPPEACDDGNTAPGDGCDALCQSEVVAAECGNQIVEPGETCDDGNTTPGDGCDANCVIECQGQPQSPDLPDPAFEDA